MAAAKGKTGGKKRKDVPWTKIRREYLSNEISQAALAEKYGVPVKTLESRAAKEGWTALRRKTWEKIREREPERMARAYGKRFERVTNLLLERLENAAVSEPSGAKHVKSTKTEKTETGEKVTISDVYTREAIPYEDPAQLKMLIESTERISGILQGLGKKQSGADGMQIEFVGDAEELAE